jgi:hypothetical protein
MQASDHTKNQEHENEAVPTRGLVNLLATLFVEQRPPTTTTTTTTTITYSDETVVSLLVEHVGHWGRYGPCCVPADCAMLPPPPSNLHKLTTAYNTESFQMN